MVDRERPGSPTKRTYLWQYFGFDGGDAPYTVFDFARTRAHTAPKAFLQGFSGTLLTDGYSAYRSLENMTHAGCMAHARRKFDEAMATSPLIALRAIALIGKLYAIEKQCVSLEADARREFRKRESSGYMLRLRLFLEQERSRVLPQSKIGEAIGYTLNQWPELCRFIDDGHLPIDNNAVEREMKAIATGKKNWLFFGSERGGRAAAVIYSIIASARRHDLDVWRYLGDILRRLADLRPGELDRLLPDVWLREHPCPKDTPASASASPTAACPPRAATSSATPHAIPRTVTTRQSARRRISPRPESMVSPLTGRRVEVRARMSVRVFLGRPATEACQRLTRIAPMGRNTGAMESVGSARNRKVFPELVAWQAVANGRCKIRTCGLLGVKLAVGPIPFWEVTPLT